MKKIIILTSVLLITTIVLAVFYFSNLGIETRNNDKILVQLPEETALIFQFKNDRSFDEVFKDYELFNVIIGDQRITELKQIRQLLLFQPQISEITTNQNVFLSFYPVSSDSLDMLLTMTLNNQTTALEIYELLLQPSNDFSAKEISVSKQNILEITIKSLNKKFYLFIGKGMAAASFSTAIIQKFLDKTTPKISKEFISEITRSNQKNENSPFNLFVNHKSVFSFTNHFLRNKTNSNFQLLNKLDGFSILNMNFKGDALMFNGISKVDTASGNYLNLFLRQKPVTTEIKKIFPVNTSNYIAFGISDYNLFHTNLKQLLNKHRELTKLTDQIGRIREKYGSNPERDFEKVWGNEFSTIQLSSNEKLAVISTRDGFLLRSLLEPLSSERTETVRQFNDSNLLYYFFGEPLKAFSRPYFAIVDTYLIVANDPSTVRRFLDDYTNSNFLYKTTEFSEFNQLVANQSNVTFFLHNKNSGFILKNTLKKTYADLFAPETSGFKDFYGFSYQWSADGDHFFTNIYTSYTSSGTDKLNLAWKYKLNGRLAINPQIVSGKNNQKLIVVQDNVNNLYILSENGEKLWSTQLNGKIAGKINQLKDSTLLFNTPDRIYRIDIAGNTFKGFPVSLSQKASYGLTITDNDPAVLKIFIPCGNQIVAYDAAGTSINGWNKSIDGKILFDLKTATVANTNYLIAGTETGVFYFFNYNGNLAGKSENALKSQFKNPLSLETKNGITSGIVTSDTSGTIRNISFEGKITGKNTGTWSGEHYFDSYNITGDSSPEYIYLDKNQLYVYDSSNALVYNYDFGNITPGRPQFFPLNQSAYRIGISATQGNLLYLFDDSGNIEKGFPVTGVPFFYAGSLINNGLQYLICGDSNNYLYVYKL